MKVIDLATTKALLGIDNTAQDDAINAQLPIIDAKTKDVCNNNFNLQIYGKFTAGSKIVELYEINNCRVRYNSWPTPEMELLLRDLPTGTLLEGDPITAVGRIDEIYYNGLTQGGINMPSLQLDENATQSGDFYFYAGINVAFQSIVAKGVQYLMNGTNTTLPSAGLSGESIGSYSYQLSQGDQTIDGKSGMPSWFVKGLPRYMR